MGGMMSAVVAILGIAWTIGAASMGAPPFFALFGVVFIVVAVVQALYHWKNATSGNRFSSYDITDEGEEPDPLQSRFQIPPPSSNPSPAQFCPYCGKPVNRDHVYCRNCGKTL
jgi:hypothetical protein